MADGERRMLFDTRGRRRRVIQVVYVTLALLMAGSLFLVVGPFSLGELGGGTTTSSSEVFEGQAGNIEERLAKSPKDEGLLIALARARINAGNALLEIDPNTGARTVTPEALDQFEQGEEAWSRYLKQAGDDPSASTAQLVASSFFSLAESGTTLDEIVEKVAIAAQAQRIVAEQRPSVGSYSALAIYEFYAGNFAAGDEAIEQAVAKAPSKATAKRVEKQLSSYRKRAKAFEKQKNKAAKVEGKADKEKVFGDLNGGAPSLVP